MLAKDAHADKAGIKAVLIELGKGALKEKIGLKVWVDSKVAASFGRALKVRR